MCGIVGVYGNKSAANLTYFGLYALQHRGQESCGIASADGQNINIIKGVGLVRDVFKDKSILDKLTGNIAIGHVRYSTTGGTGLSNAQPIVKNNVSLVHNGNLVNTRSLEKIIGNVPREGSTDSELIANLIQLSPKQLLAEKVADSLKLLHGAYSLIVINESELICARDPYGFRPLVLGKIENKGNVTYIAASETCALDLLGADFVRDIQRGEVLAINENGTESCSIGEKEPRFCSFEFAYFSRPDSFFESHTGGIIQKKLGMELAKVLPVDADIVVPVPDSGMAAAEGYSEASGIPLSFALIRNHYVGRTFILPEQGLRELDLRLKINPTHAKIDNKKVIVVDDSIVRGTVSRKIVSMLRKAGAREVHLRINTPPVIGPCYYGIDTPEKDKLIANGKSTEEIKDYTGADSLAYQRIATYMEIINKNHCFACHTLEYPVTD